MISKSINSTKNAIKFDCVNCDKKMFDQIGIDVL